MYRGINRLKGVTGSVSRGKEYLSLSVHHTKGRRCVLTAVELLSYLLVIARNQLPRILIEHDQAWGQWTEWYPPRNPRASIASADIDIVSMYQDRGTRSMVIVRLQLFEHVISPEDAPRGYLFKTSFVRFGRSRFVFPFATTAITQKKLQVNTHSFLIWAHKIQPITFNRWG